MKHGSFSDDEEELEHYELIRKLDHGRTSVVYEGRHRSNQKLVAIKQVRHGSTAAFQREVSILRQLEGGPHILPLLDAVQTLDYSYLMFDPLDRTLEQYVTSTAKMSMGGMKSCLQRILQALAYCHARHILHRDVKLNNIMLSRDLEVYLIDFGQAHCFLKPLSEKSLF